MAAAFRRRVGIRNRTTENPNVEERRERHVGGADRAPTVRAELVEALPFLRREKRRTALRQAQGERSGARKLCVPPQGRQRLVRAPQPRDGLVDHRAVRAGVVAVADEAFGGGGGGVHGLGAD